MSTRHLAFPSLALSGAVLALVTACGGRDVTLADGIGGSGGTGGSGGGSGSCGLTFVAPSDGAVLTRDDDASGDQCADGFQYDVRVNSDAPNGSTARLFAGSQQVGSATVQGGSIVFSNVQLAAQGATSLRVSVDQVAGCEGSIEIEVDCGLPTCEIVQPVISTAKPKLNGIPVADGGDRTSAAGAPYQTSFQVSTDISNGQPVVLRINGEKSGFSSVAQDGIATFPGVTLDPDGTYTVEADCHGEDGARGRSAAGTYVVDTAPPTLTVQKVKGGTASLLENGDHFGPGDLDGDKLRICGVTTSADATDLAAALGAAQNNLCVGVGTSTPACVPATKDGAPNGDGACVDITCPGAGLFALDVSLRDDAGNQTAILTENITCASSLPQVQFLDPVSDSAPFADVSKRLLAADNTHPSAERKDKDAQTPGAQYDVTICTTTPEGTARLLAGPATGTPTNEIATATIQGTNPGDNCPVGMTGKAVFANVTVPESSHGVGGVLATATRLRAEVTDLSNASNSTQVDLWVDSVNPSLTISSPPNFCNSYIDSDVDVMRNLTFTTSIVPVELRVNGASCGTSCTGGTTLAFGATTFADVALPLGANALTAWVTKPSTNEGRLASPCDVTVGTEPPPEVTWEEPVSTSRLVAMGTTGVVAIADTDSGSPGWQGTLRVCTNIDPVEHPEAAVHFTANGESLDDPVHVGPDGCAELVATVPEGFPVQLRATTSAVNGVEGIATINVPVDVTPPSAISALTPAVLNRRATSFRLTWNAPADNLGLQGYQVRVRADAPITDEADFNAASSIAYASLPSAAGSPDSVDVLSRLIETDYHFAVRPVDLVGNLGPIVATSEATRAEFKAVLLSAPEDSVENFGSPIDGSADLDGDGYSDIVVGNLLSSSSVRIYFGGPEGPSEGASTLISGTMAGFGAGVAIAELNGDTSPEVIIGSPNENSVYVFNGRSSWPASLSATDASTVIRVDTDEMGSTALGVSLARLGDFNGDGREDLAIGAPFFDSGRGLVAVVLGKEGGWGSEVLLPDAFGTDAIRLEGEPGQIGNFGWSVIGPGHFFDEARTDLVVAAPLQGGTQGRAFAFRGRALNGATVYSNEADATLVGTASQYVGYEGMTLMGKTGPLGQPALGFSLPYVSGKGRAMVFSGTDESGPFATLLTELRTSEAGGGGTGRITGGGFSGTSSTVSVLRSSAPDLVIPSMATGVAPTNGPKIFILSAETLQSIGSTLTDIESVADVTYMLPVPWAGIARNVTILRDVDGDGYGDIAVGDVSYDVPVDGKVLVLH